MTAHNQRRPIREQFYMLDVDRQYALDRKREHASLTIPALLPYEGRTIHTPLEVPYNTVPAEGINALASRIMSVVFPLNGQSVFEILLQQPFQPDGRDDSEMSASFARFERTVMDTLAPTNLRSTVNLAYKHLLAIGDGLVHMDDDFNFRFFRADQFVVRRRHEGDWKEIIIVEGVLPEWDQDLQRIAANTSKVTDIPRFLAGSASGHDEEWEGLYTRIVKRNNGTLEITQEFRDTVVARRTEKVPSYFPMRWGAIAGEPYGMSMVEDMFGDIRHLDAVSKALLDGTLLNSEYRWGMNPAGISEMQDWMDSVNGDTVAVGPGDIYPLQFQNNGAVQSAFQAVTHRESVVGRRFLMNSAIQPSGERVTARQVSILAQELEQQLGGVLSSAAREIQEPVLRRVLYVMGQKNLIPKEISEQINKQGGFVKLRIRAGLEILNREAEREKIDAAIERVRNLPPEAGEAFIWPAIARDWWQSMGLETKGRIRTDEEVDQRRQAEQQRMMQMQAMQTGLQAGAQAQERTQ